jgi:GAF domain-containing protein
MGVVTALHSVRSRKFSKEDREVLIILADHMENAIRNAWRVHDLREEASQNLRRRAAF